MLAERLTNEEHRLFAWLSERFSPFAAAPKSSRTRRKPPIPITRMRVPRPRFACSGALPLSLGTGHSGRSEESALVGWRREFALFTVSKRSPTSSCVEAELCSPGQVRAPVPTRTNASNKKASHLRERLGEGLGLLRGRS